VIRKIHFLLFADDGMPEGQPDEVRFGSKAELPALVVTMVAFADQTNIADIAKN
jgi:hypothetical protein